MISPIRDPIRVLPFAALTLGCAAPAAAQNVGGVFGPDVAPSISAIEARTAFAPATDGGEDGFTARIHYQRPVTDDLRLRAVIQGSDTGPGGFDFRFAQFEAQWQFAEDDVAGWDGAVRFDARVADENGGPDLVSFNWTSDHPIGEAWFIRAIALASVQFGANGGEGLFLETRTGINRRLGPRWRIELQSFNVYGSTADFARLSDQSHSLGPAVTGSLGGGWSLQTGVLGGLTEPVADVDWRVFLTKAF